jgi:hypothetical protein
MSVWNNCEWARLDRNALIESIAGIVEKHLDVTWADRKAAFDVAEEILGLMKCDDEIANTR